MFKKLLFFTKDFCLTGLFTYYLSLSVERVLFSKDGILIFSVAQRLYSCRITAILPKHKAQYFVTGDSNKVFIQPCTVAGSVFRFCFSLFLFTNAVYLKANYSAERSCKSVAHKGSRRATEHFTALISDGGWLFCSHAMYELCRNDMASSAQNELWSFECWRSAGVDSTVTTPVLPSESLQSGSISSPRETTKLIH